MRIIKTPKLVKWVTPSLIWSIPSVKPTIYLTFDDGPIPIITDKVLEYLKKYNAKATFFCVGENVYKNPEVFQNILQHGHHVGNHTYNHVQCTKVSQVDYLHNIEKASRLIPSNLFRPPHGKISPKLIQLIKINYKIIMWDVMSYDFDETLSPENCLKNLIKYTKHGSIVVMHDSMKSEQTVDYVLPRFLDHFSSKGYCFEAINMCQPLNIRS